MQGEMRPPLSRGERVKLEIKDLSHDGEGVGSWQGYTVFVPEAVPGDLVEAKVISVKKSYGRAVPVAIERPSACRTTPACAHFPRCGGCQLQHLAYADQLLFKRKAVAETLQRLGRLEPPVLPVLAMGEPWRYRNKAQVPVAAESGRLVAGFYEKRSHRVVDISGCPIQHPAGEKAVREARTALRELKIAPYDENNHRGVMRHLLVRTSFSTGEVLLALVTRSAELPDRRRLVEILKERVPGLVGIVQNINPRRGNVILGDKSVTLWGRPYLVEHIDGLSFRISPQSFAQINPAQAAVLYGKVREYAGLTGAETVCDLYCGTGTIALLLSRAAVRVVGVETVLSAVADARQNAADNQITNVDFHAGRAEAVVPQLKAKGLSADVVVVDPPRKGCAPELLNTIAAMAPQRVVYVSCNPATLARDLRYLADRGYLTTEVQPVDMFPHTSHVETVIKIERK